MVLFVSWLSILVGLHLHYTQPDFFCFLFFPSFFHSSLLMQAAKTAYKSML